MLFNLFLCVFCDSLVRADTPLATCHSCNDYKGLLFVGTSIDMTCYCGIPTCLECELDRHDVAEIDSDSFLPIQTVEPPF